MTLDQTVVKEVASYLRGHTDEEDDWGCDQAADKLEKGDPTEAIECLEAFKEAAEDEVSEEEQIGGSNPNYDTRLMNTFQLEADKFKAWIAALKK